MAKAQKTKYAILGALTIHPMSGYDIKKWVAEVTGSFWAESSGQVYPTLAQLLKDNLARCDEDASMNKRIRKLYSITRQGQKELTVWLNKSVEHPVNRDELRLKIFYGKNILKTDCIRHLLQRREQAAKLLKKHKEIEKHLKTEHKSQEDSYYWLLNLKGAIYHGEAEVKWCQDVIKILKRAEKNK